jgi:AraC-like DNA-binding protein
MQRTKERCAALKTSFDTKSDTIDIMIWATYKPAAPLSEFVDLFWFWEGYCVPHVKERHLPGGTLSLAINLSEDAVRVYSHNDPNYFHQFRGSVISGAQSKFSIIDTSCQTTNIGVRFKPGGAFPFFNLPLGELSDLHVSLETVWGVRADELRERLLEARTPGAKFRTLEQSLLKEATSRLIQNPAVTFALNAFKTVPQVENVSEVIRQIGLSHRRFIHIFKQEVGLTPKTFCRVARFQKALHVISEAGIIDWADIAPACGYFDQSHFIKDFTEFCGVSPSVYLTHRGEHLNHVRLDG